MMTDELAKSFSINATYIGFFSSFYYLSYSFSLIPLGVLMDQYGPKKIMFLGPLLCGIGCLLFSFSTSYGIACFSRFIMGLGASFAFLGTLKLGSLWFPPKDFAKVVALAMVFGTLGAVLGGVPLELSLSKLGWRKVFWFLSIFGFSLSFVLYFVIKQSNIVADKIYYGSIFKKFFETLKSREAWFIASYASMMYFPLILFGDFSGVSFLERAYNVEESLAATVVASFFIGVAFGSPSFSLFSDYLKTRKVPMQLSSFSCFCLSIIIIYTTTLPFNFMYVIFFLMGFFFGGKSISFTAIVEKISKENTGIAVAFINTLVMTGGVIILPLFGWLLDFHSTKLGYADMRNYTADDFRFALSIIPFSIFVSGLCITFTTETFKSSNKK
tara:strand:- start:26 stop:1180 length:1155 start_codon:yes stop_codon:yes gene_type:complete